MLISVPILPLQRASVPQHDPREANCRSERTTAQGPQVGNGCISAYPDLVEDATGETVQLVRQAVSEARRAYVLLNIRNKGTAPLTVQGLSEMLRG